MKPCIVVGIGQMGAVFSHALLRAGHPLYPVRRGESLHSPALPREPAMVVIAVGEADLQAVLKDTPEWLQEHLVLLQNELLPPDWEAHGIKDPTVAVVWFEKKVGIATHAIQSTPIAGSEAQELVNALGSIGIAAHEVSREALTAELVAKNVYILTANLGGLAVGGGIRVGKLWQEHRTAVEAIARDAIGLQEALLGASLDAEAQLQALERAIMADPEHKAMGRSAPARLQRALALAKSHGLDLESIAQIKPA